MLAQEGRVFGREPACFQGISPPLLGHQPSRRRPLRRPRIGAIQPEVSMPDHALPDDQTVSFVRMDKGTKEDYALLGAREHDLIKQLPEFILAQMKTLAMPGSGYKIDRYEHSLQTASRAFREGADEE